MHCICVEKYLLVPLLYLEKNISDEIEIYILASSTYTKAEREKSYLEKWRELGAFQEYIRQIWAKITRKYYRWVTKL